MTEVVDDTESLFRLRIVANVDKNIPEINYDNNGAEITFRMNQIRRETEIDYGYLPED